jgi:hypothetical protein
MNWYNGFSPEQRAASGAWVKEQVQLGLYVWPTRCEACGQDTGIFDTHVEDYSQPYGDHNYAYPLCFRCHMVLHLRFRMPSLWSEYRAHIRDGFRFQACFQRNLYAVIAMANNPWSVPHEQDAGEKCAVRFFDGESVLDLIEHGIIRRNKHPCPDQIPDLTAGKRPSFGLRPVYDDKGVMIPGKDAGPLSPDVLREMARLGRSFGKQPGPQKRPQNEQKLLF